jgi:SlyX protein
MKVGVFAKDITASPIRHRAIWMANRKHRWAPTTAASVILHAVVGCPLPAMNKEAIELIEMKIAFLERANQELSDVVYRQQQEIEAQRLRITELAGRIESQAATATVYSQEEERPPHY